MPGKQKSDKWSNRQHKSTNVRLKKAKLRALSLVLSLANRLAPQKTRRFLLTKFFAPQKPPLTKAQSRVLEKAERFEIRVNGQALACWRWGAGPAVLFVHGWDSRGIHFHRFFEPLMEAGLSIIAYDAPAHGQSEGQGTNYFEFSDAVRGILKMDRGRDIRAIVAHSLGGGAVINALEKEGGDYKTVLIAPALKLKEMLIRAFTRNGIPTSLYLGIINDLQTRHGYDLARDNPFELAGRIKSGLLIIQDEGDATISIKDSQKLAAGQGAISLSITTGLGHNRIVSDAGVIDQTIEYLTASNQGEQNFRQEVCD